LEPNPYWLRALKGKAGRLKRALRRVSSALSADRSQGADPSDSAPVRALDWIRSNELPTGGIRVHSSHATAYPEVSGYLVPTLLACGEVALAERILYWLVATQRGDGSFTDADCGNPFVFDTGQVLRGLLAGSALVPEAADAARRSADWLCDQVLEGGKDGFGQRYAGDVPEPVHLYTLPPLVEAGTFFNEPRYQRVAEQCAAHYVESGQLLDLALLTHFLGYHLEALIDLGHLELVQQPLSQLQSLQQPDGAVRGQDRARWVCAPGLAQLAICWYKTGHPEPADRALSWLESKQKPSGGFLGSYGKGAAYFPGEELSWAAKFYLDAHLLRTKTFFDTNAEIFPSGIAKEDGRATAIRKLIKEGDKVLEVGCGKGRFLKMVLESLPSCECTGVDISPVLLSCMPPGIKPITGPLEHIPCPDESFDVVFSVEALEHSVNPEVAIKEMVRVTRRGGWVAVIDKQRSQWGRLACPPWERWPDIDAVCRLLGQGCDEVSAETVGYDGKPDSDGLMAIWRGRKREALSGPEWNQILARRDAVMTTAESVRANRLPLWGQSIALATKPGNSLLEVGSGTGQISLQLAVGGRRVTLLDSSRDSLVTALECAQELGVEVQAVQADATAALPFADNSIDCVWSSGLLEHFSGDERRQMLRDWSRLAAKCVITLVPNAHCVAYRAGKSLLEEGGNWPYGHESPLASLREDFLAAGLEVVAETTLGAMHALDFLPDKHPLREAMFDWVRRTGTDAADAAGQGYLLCTIGIPAGQ